MSRLYADTVRLRVKRLVRREIGSVDVRQSADVTSGQTWHAVNKNNKNRKCQADSADRTAPRESCDKRQGRGAPVFACVLLEHLVIWQCQECFSFMIGRITIGGGLFRDAKLSGKELEKKEKKEKKHKKDVDLYLVGSSRSDPRVKISPQKQQWRLEVFQQFVHR